MPEGSVYSLSVTRSGIPSALKNLYVTSASEIVARKAAPANPPTEELWPLG